LRSGNKGQQYQPKQVYMLIHVQGK
jgi:hypothetical protein